MGHLTGVQMRLNEQGAPGGGSHILAACMHWRSEQNAYLLGSPLRTALCLMMMNKNQHTRFEKLKTGQLYRAPHHAPLKWHHMIQKSIHCCIKHLQGDQRSLLWPFVHVMLPWWYLGLMSQHVTSKHDVLRGILSLALENKLRRDDPDADVRAAKELLLAARHAWKWVKHCT